MIVDPVHERLVAYGGENTKWSVSQDVWVKPLSGATPWTRLDIAGPLPMPRSAHAAIYDPVRDRMVVFGDTYTSDSASAWALSLSGTPAWTQLTPAGSGPGFRSGVSGIYDPTHDRMLVFGGYSTRQDSLTNDVWALSLAGTPEWTRIIPAGTLPTRRTVAAVCYDPRGARMIVFGGYQDLREQGDGSPGDAPCRDVWALSLGEQPRWTQLQPAGDLPPRLYGCACAYDAARGQVLVQGGTDSTLATVHAETWALQLGGAPHWSQLAPGGALLPARSGASAVHDREHDRLVVFGGWASDTWALPLARLGAWSELEPGDRFGPGGRYGHSAVYDAAHHQVLLFGGTFYAYDTGLDPRYWQLNDLWSLTFGLRAKWKPVPLVSPPPPGTGHSAILDPASDRLVIFGGTVPNPDDLGPVDTLTSDTWQISLTGTATCTRIDARDSLPPARSFHTAVYDPRRHRMIVFGGSTMSGPLGDLWALALDDHPRWSRLTASGSGPRPRYGHCAVYDPEGDRMIVFGGYDGTKALNDTWQLSLADRPAWSSVRSAMHPPTRMSASMVVDSWRHRIVLFGGAGFPFGGAGLSNGLNDTWLLPLGVGAGWAPAELNGAVPAPRAGAAAVFDVDTRLTVLLDGLQPFPELDYDSAVWALGRAWPGEEDGGRFGRDIAARAGSGDAPREPTSDFALFGALPNPASRDLTVRFSLPGPGAARIDVTDVAGRRVLSRDVGILGAGEHTLALAPAQELPPGLYLVRLTRRGESLVRRACVVR